MADVSLPMLFQAAACDVGKLRKSFLQSSCHGMVSFLNVSSSRAIFNLHVNALSIPPRFDSQVLASLVRLLAIERWQMQFGRAVSSAFAHLLIPRAAVF